MEFKDYYATLGVAKTATDAEIKRAYRKLARAHHPDLNPGDKKAEVRFKEINEAHEVLSDATSRRKYDELGANWRAYEQAPAGTAGGGWPGGFGGTGGRTQSRTMSPEEMEAMFGVGDGSFSDFFQTFFGGAASARPSGRGARQARGRDIEYAVELTLEEAFTGASRRVVATRDGKERSIDVRIPPGVTDGSRVRATGEGSPSAGGGKAGDLYLRVSLQPHESFERRGPDLYVKVDTPVTTAVLGGEVAVPAITGGTLRLKVPELTPAGRTLRLRGHGMPVVGQPGQRGDLYAAIQVQLPTILSEDTRRLYEALKATEASPRSTP
jgi:DnaJ-class molecular chaperone